jgi:hypothetical protein
MEHGEILWGNRRLPLFPLLMTIIVQPLKFFEIEYPYLISAYLINIISLCLSIPILYLINKKILKKTVLALISTFLFMINPEYLLWNIQPILETFFVFSILLTFYFHFFKRLELKYLGVCFASLIRYEAVLLAPIFVIDAILYKKEIKKSLLLGSISILPLFFWIVSAYIFYGSTIYLQPALFDSHAGVHFLYSINATVSLGIHYGMSGIRFLGTRAAVSLILIIGIIYFHKNRFFTSLFLWFGGYTALHMYFFFNFYRFVLPILWLVITFCIYGVYMLYCSLRKRIHSNLSIFHKLFLLISVIVFFSFYQFYNKQFILNALLIDISVILALLLVFSITIFLETNRLTMYKVSFILAILLLTTSAAIFNGDIRTNEVAYQMIQFRKVGEWYKIVAKDGDVLVATSPGMIQYYSGLPDEYFARTNEFHANNTAEFIEELTNRGVTYVVWDSKQGNRSKDYYYYVLNVELISFLSDGTDKPHFKLVHTVNIHSHIAYVYKFTH